MPVILRKHQAVLLEQTESFNRVGYFADVGLGKTFIAGEKHRMLNAPKALVICQKSKIEDWIDHFQTHYNLPAIQYKKHRIDQLPERCVLVINYDLVWRRPELKKLTNYTLILDESSCIRDETAKRTKFILSLNPENVILLSGTPVGGKYEQLYSQLSLLGWKISKKLFWTQYIITKKAEDANGYIRTEVVGYKNVDRLKAKLRQHGAVFLTADDAGIDLPDQVEIQLPVTLTKAYRKFKRDRIIKITPAGNVFVDDSDFYGTDVTPRIELVGDTPLKRMLYLRQLASIYNPNKWERLQDLLESTGDRMIVFYNFVREYEEIKRIARRLDRPLSWINGDGKNLTAYRKHDDSIIAVQYQSGAMGENLQLANKAVFVSPPLDSILYEQAFGRIRRDGQQSDRVFYYFLTTKGSIEEHIYETLKQRKDFTDELFKEVYDD